MIFHIFSFSCETFPRLQMVMTYDTALLLLKVVVYYVLKLPCLLYFSYKTS